MVGSIGVVSSTQCYVCMAFFGADSSIIPFDSVGVLLSVLVSCSSYGNFVFSCWIDFCQFIWRFFWGWAVQREQTTQAYA